MRSAVRRHGFDYAGGFTLDGRHTISPALVVFDRSDAEQYAAGGAALLRTVEKIKDALDPAGVLSPGKQGVWPRRLRARG